MSNSGHVNLLVDLLLYIVERYKREKESHKASSIERVQSRPTESLACVKAIFDLYKINNNEEIIYNDKDHGMNVYGQFYTFILLSYIFLDDKITIMREYMPQPTKIGRHVTYDTNNEMILIEDIDNCIALGISAEYDSGDAHATCFLNIKCDDDKQETYWFDNNNYDIGTLTKVPNISNWKDYFFYQINSNGILNINAILDVLTDKSGPIKYFDYEHTPPNKIGFTILIQIYNYKKTFKHSLHIALVRFFMLNFKNIPGKVYPLIVIDKEKKNFKLNELIQKLQESKEDFDINKYITDNYYFLNYMKNRYKRILLYHIIDYYEKNNKYDINIIKYFKNIEGIEGIDYSLLDRFNLSKPDISNDKLYFLCELVVNLDFKDLYQYKISDDNLFEFVLRKYLTTNKKLDIINILKKFNKNNQSQYLITFKAFKLIHKNNIDSNKLLSYYTFLFMYTYDLTEIEENEILTYKINDNSVLSYFINEYINNDIKFSKKYNKPENSDVMYDIFIDFSFWNPDLVYKLINYKYKDKDNIIILDIINDILEKVIPDFERIPFEQETNEYKNFVKYTKIFLALLEYTNLNYGRGDTSVFKQIFEVIERLLSRVGLLSPNIKNNLYYNFLLDIFKRCPCWCNQKLNVDEFQRLSRFQVNFSYQLVSIQVSWVGRYCYTEII